MLATIDLAGDPLHHVERGTDRVLLLAHGEHGGDASRGAAQRRSSRASRTTSCALGGSGGRGGRRSTISLPSRSIR